MGQRSPNCRPYRTAPDRARIGTWTALGYRVRTIDETGAGWLHSGTSFSAPIITGAVALVAQAFPNMTGAQIVDLLFSTADDLRRGGRRCDLRPGPAQHRARIPAGRDNKPGRNRSGGDHRRARRAACPRRPATARRARWAPSSSTVRGAFVMDLAGASPGREREAAGTGADRTRKAQRCGPGRSRSR